MKERTLQDAIQQFKSGIKQTDYGKVKGNKDYLSVAYRLKFCREYFGEKMSIQTDSIELSNGSHKFKANIYLNDKLVSVGESKQMSNKEKDFEKSQTVSIGRSLSILGFMGDEIASKDEMESFLQDDKPFDDKKEVAKPIVKLVPKAKVNIEELANDWIEVLKKTAENSNSLSNYEKNLNVLRKEYISDLHQIYTDLVQQQRIDSAYISLQQTITNRKI